METRAGRAVRGIRENRVKRYRDLWVVVGNEEEYVVEGRFCSCPDYFYNVSARDPSATRCWHSIAVELAKKSSNYDEVDETYHHYMDL